MLLLRCFLTSNKSEYNREITRVLFALVRMKSLLYNKMYPSWYQAEPI
ncbi:hypothetical protein CLV99_3819 [Sphingobacterium yanglingense]|uniref:Uncharacterized protein n=1 Tax=Sphingobacterium yanglingense TaxID=1437280 RepID=A0A4R6WBN8_9SPHI|nr:hypothetical protein CLV99_3819 [Sphingobacterium yanglingense]